MQNIYYKVLEICKNIKMLFNKINSFLQLKKKRKKDSRKKVILKNKNRKSELLIH